jgi:hypothetical protein
MFLALVVTEQMSFETIQEGFFLPQCTASGWGHEEVLRCDSGCSV